MCLCVEECDSCVYGTPVECVCVCVCVRERERQLRALDLYTTEMIFPWVELSSHPLCPASHKRHRAVRSDATFRHFGHANPDSGL